MITISSESKIFRRIPLLFPWERLERRFSPCGFPQFLLFFTHLYAPLWGILLDLTNKTNYTVMEVKFGEAEIKDLLVKVKIFKPELGDYQLHTMNEQFMYFVKLSNGSITISITDLIANQNHAHNPNTLMNLANSFKRDGGNTQEEKTADYSNPNQVNSSAQNQSTSYIEVPEKKSSSIKKIILVVSLLIVAGFVVVYLQNEDNPSKNGNQSWEPRNADREVKREYKTEKQIKTDLFTIEATNPTKYLSAQFRYRLNLVNQLVIDGELYNTATLCTFKNVTVRVTAFSKTNANLGSANYTVMEFVQPNRSTSFKLKTSDSWDSRTSRIEMSIINADSQ
jgi:hypothetical protein